MYSCHPILKCSLTFPTPTSLSYKQAGRFYIGSTSIGMAKREFNRMAKYRLAKAGTPVHVELAVKYWSRRSDFSNFTAIPIASFSTYQEAWIFEHLLISRWQPTVEPSIYHQNLDAESIRMAGSVQETFSDISFYSTGNQICFKDYADDSLPKVFLPPFTANKLKLGTFFLSSQVLAASPLTQRQPSGLRKFDDWEIYVLYRLCNHLEQPARGRARKLLASAMKFRNMTIPKLNRPATMPFFGTL